MQLDLYKDEGEAAYAEALACADKATAKEANGCLEALAKPKPGQRGTAAGTEK